MRDDFKTTLLIIISAILICLTVCLSAAYGQITQAATGNELTQLKITVSRRVTNVEATEPGGKINRSIDDQSANDQSGREIKTLPIQEVPQLEAGDVLNIRFCDRCPGRSFSDLGYKKILVFFVNPASVANDLRSSESVLGTSTTANTAAQKEAVVKPNIRSTGIIDSAKTKPIAEIRFDGDLKAKKNQPKIFGEHHFLVPYKSIPMIFFVSDGDYKDVLRKTILEKQADILKLSEQATLISQLPQAVSFLLDVKAALQTPAIYNTEVTQDLIQRAQIFRFNQTNCFQQTYLYKTDDAKLGCLVKNVNPDELTSDIQSFSLAKFGKIGGAETVAQLKSRYESLNIFFDAASAAIEITSRLFQKKPLNIQLATLQLIAPVSATSSMQTIPQPVAPNQMSSQEQASIPTAFITGRQIPTIAKGADKTDKTDFLSLRQFAMNTPTGAEKALIIAPLKWKEAEEIVQPADLQAIELYPACHCLHPGKNTFWLDTDNPLVRQELKTVSIVLQKKEDGSQIANQSPKAESVNNESVTKESISKESINKESQKLTVRSLPVNPADQSLTLTFDDTTWRKIKDWREATLTITARYAFERAEKVLELNVPKTPNWQVLRNWDDPVYKGENTILKIFPNTDQRVCLDKIILTDEKKQSVPLSPLGGYRQEATSLVRLNLNAKLLDKLQPGKIAIEVYENGADTPTGKMTFTLAAKPATK